MTVFWEPDAYSAGESASPGAIVWLTPEHYVRDENVSLCPGRVNVDR